MRSQCRNRVAPLVVLLISRALLACDGGSDAEAKGDGGAPGLVDAGQAKTEDSYARLQSLFAALPQPCGNFGCHGSGAGLEPSSRFWVEVFPDQPPVDRFREWAGREALLCAREGRSMKRIDPGSPETSYIVHALRGTNLCGGMRMPPGGPYLDEAQIQSIERLIGDL